MLKGANKLFILIFYQFLLFMITTYHFKGNIYFLSKTICLCLNNYDLVIFDITSTERKKIKTNCLENQLLRIRNRLRKWMTKITSSWLVTNILGDLHNSLNEAFWGMRRISWITTLGPRVVNLIGKWTQLLDLCNLKHQPLIYYKFLRLLLSFLA